MSAHDGTRYLVFSLSGEHYALPLLDTREVIPYAETTPVPYTPAYFKGILNLRGQVISVIDLRMKLGLAKAEIGPETAIVILDRPAHPLGVVVDTVDSVMVLKPADVATMPVLESTAAACVNGVARRERDLILLLDIEKTVSMEELRSFRKTG